MKTNEQKAQSDKKLNAITEDHGDSEDIEIVFSKNLPLVDNITGKSSTATGDNSQSTPVPDTPVSDEEKINLNYESYAAQQMRKVLKNLPSNQIMGKDHWREPKTNNNAPISQNDNPDEEENKNTSPNTSIADKEIIADLVVATGKKHKSCCCCSK